MVFHLLQSRWRSSNSSLQCSIAGRHVSNCLLSTADAQCQASDETSVSQELSGWYGMPPKSVQGSLQLVVLLQLFVRWLHVQLSATAHGMGHVLHTSESTH